MTEDLKSKAQEWLQFAYLAQWRFSEVLALSIVCALGVVILTVHLLTWGVQTYQESKFLRQIPCVIDGVVARPDPENPTKFFRPEVKISYEFEGESFTTTTYDRQTLTDDEGFVYDNKEALLRIAPFCPGQKTLCWIRVDDPTQAVLVKSSPLWGWLFLIIPTLLIFSAGSLLAARLYDRLLSEEARASVKKQRTRYPTLPNVPDEGTASGVALAYRLTPRVRPSFSMWSRAFGVCVWNVASWTIFLGVLTTAETRGDFWSACAFGAVFCGVGVVFARRFFSFFRTVRSAGAMELEISTLPILPGRKIRFNLFLRGRVSAKRLDVFLTCEEVARFVQGTNSITHRYEAYSATLFTRYGVEVPSHETFVEKFTAITPIGAAPSFVSEHNEISWRVVVKLEFADGGSYSRDYDVIVYPFLPKER